MSERTLVKICGVRTPEAALVAADAGADLLGLVFYPPSPRHIAPAEGAEIVRALGAHGLRPVVVGLFVNETPERINRTAREVGLDMAQLCGDEQPADLARVELPLLRSLRLTPDDSLARARARLTAATVMTQGREPGPLGRPLTPLLDAHVPGRYGGTGARADWEQAATLARLWPLFLAGGLTPQNVGPAIVQVRPLGVDVSSGVETAGTKNPEKIVRFIKAAHSADKALSLGNEAAYRCRVCGLEQSEPPWGPAGESPTYDICACCGVEFGYQDFTLAAVQKYRERWLASGAQWRDSTYQPHDWNLERQLATIPAAYR
jgi:phosphoribosylanthranilate isomerase